MIRIVLVCSLALLVSGCALDAFSRPSLIAYGGAPSSAKAPKHKAVHIAKAKPKAAPTIIAPQPAAPAPKEKPKKKKHWYTPWRK